MELIGFIFNTIVYYPMLNAMLFLYSLIPNYGVAIILFTLIVGVATMPFRIKSQQSMKAQQEKMAKLKPELDAVKKKYKDNPQELQRQQMKLYQEHGVANPFNIGCLLTLLPFPIFIGMYQVISGVMAERPEQVLQLSHQIYPWLPNAAALIPVNSNFFGLDLGAVLNTQPLLIAGAVILLVVGSQFLQTKMMSSPTAMLDPQQAQMNQSMMLMMPIMFGFFVWSAPIGLALYWITFSVIGILQQGLTGGWGSLANLLPKAAPSPTRTKRNVVLTAEQLKPDTTPIQAMTTKDRTKAERVQEQEAAELARAEMDDTLADDDTDEEQEDAPAVAGGARVARAREERAETKSILDTLRDLIMGLLGRKEPEAGNAATATKGSGSYTSGVSSNGNAGYKNDGATAPKAKQSTKSKNSRRNKRKNRR
jgi:YidC/Oxa1 family membrane protein insertase